MDTRSLGRTDLRLSEITLGTWGLATGAYGPVDDARFDATVKAAIEAGVTTFDVAPVWGEAEARIGQLVSDAKIDAVIITRGGARWVDGELQQSFETDALVADCEASLERLGRETIDLWLLHNPGDVTLRRESFQDAIAQLEEEGKIRAWGVSCGDAEEARLAIAAGAQAICLTYNLLRPSVLEDLATDLAVNGCGVLARSPLMYGMLSGQWHESRVFGEEDHRKRRWATEAFLERLRHVAAMRFLVGDQHPDLATAALRYVLSSPQVTSAIVGARRPPQIDHAVDAASGPPWIDDDDMVRFRKVASSFGL
ncbi:MAG: aldo/keto reductase [Myxococcota bacterium]|nr:aldo/keto reductase [Myxococcota bacterium]